MSKIQFIRGYTKKDGTEVSPHTREHDYAVGLPIKGKVTAVPQVLSPAVWQLGIQEHVADRAGRHYDLRLVDPATGIAHSWAIPKGALPRPGGRVLAVQQSDHRKDYVGFSGTIEAGYGKGTVKSLLNSTADVIYAAEDRVRFNIHDGVHTVELLMVRAKAGDWVLINTTLQRDPILPADKPPYKSTDVEKIDVNNKNEILQPKYDGAHVLVHLRPGRQVRVSSYRTTNRPSGIIDHTWKIDGLAGVYFPRGVKQTLLRGELVAVDKEGAALPPNKIAGILNSGVLKSREEQSRLGVALKVFVYDSIMMDGRRVAGLPYEDKLYDLEAISGVLPPQIRVAAVAHTAESKKALIAAIKSGEHPLTKEGVVLWRKRSPTPTKAKFRPDHDVYVRNIFNAASASGKELDRAGGFEYSWTPGGPVAGRVGTGFSHDELRDMKANPNKYVGRVAKVLSPGVLMTNNDKRALTGSPTFSMWHLDKGKEP